MTNITYSGAVVNIDGVTITFPYNVLDVQEHNNVVVILIDPDSYIGKEKDFKNLVAYDKSGNKLWEGEYPQIYKPDYYWAISGLQPLIVKSFSSYECEIELSTGKIVKREFYK